MDPIKFYFKNKYVLFVFYIFFIDSIHYFTKQYITCVFIRILLSVLLIFYYLKMYFKIIFVFLYLFDFLTFDLVLLM